MRDFLDIDPAYRDLLAANGLDTMDRVLAWSAGDRLDKRGLEPWRQRWRVEVAALTRRPAAHGQDTRATFYLKRFASPPLSRQFHRWREGHFFHSTAGVEWANFRALARRSIPVPRVVAVGERMSGPVEHASFILIEEVKGQSLERIAIHMGEGHPRVTSRVMDALARFVARFHLTGFVHRDLYLSHLFLLDGRAGDDPADYVLIDLQRVFRPRWLCERWIVKDLAALAFSAPEALIGPRARLRFLIRYVRSVERQQGSASARAQTRERPRWIASQVIGRLNRMNQRAERRNVTQAKPASAGSSAHSTPLP